MTFTQPTVLAWYGMLFLVLLLPAKLGATIFHCQDHSGTPIYTDSPVQLNNCQHFLGAWGHNSSSPTHVGGTSSRVTQTNRHRVEEPSPFPNPTRDYATPTDYSQYEELPRQTGALPEDSSFLTPEDSPSEIQQAIREGILREKYTQQGLIAPDMFSERAHFPDYGYGEASPDFEAGTPLPPATWP